MMRSSYKKELKIAKQYAILQYVRQDCRLADSLVWLKGRAAHS
jgi:hypothetical protein